MPTRTYHIRSLANVLGYQVLMRFADLEIVIVTTTGYGEASALQKALTHADFAYQSAVGSQA